MPRKIERLLGCRAQSAEITSYATAGIERGSLILLEEASADAQTTIEDGQKAALT